MPRSTAVGLVPAERLNHIPPTLHLNHELCYHLHDLMVMLLLDYEESGASWTEFEVDIGTDLRREGMTSGDLLSYLGEANPDIYRKILVKQLAPALLSDLLHFIFESLSCLERRKFTVALSLMRKPLKENLLHLAYLLADPVDYVKRLDDKPYSLLDVQKSEQIKPASIFGEAVKLTPCSNFFDAEFIADLIYRKTIPWGFEILCQKSTHLVTSHGDLMKTEVRNLNMIFKDPSDNDVYEFVYVRLPMLLFFTLNIVVALFGRCHPLNKKILSVWLLRAVGAYEALFVRGKSASLRSSLSRGLKTFLKCTHCQETVRLTRSQAPAFFLIESLTCQSCGADQQFPLSWLLLNYEFELQTL